MSTRATYEIDGHTFYIHHDGYPDGAAEYFREALNFAKQRKGVDGWPNCPMGDYAPNASFADDFIRANTRAELTPSHEAHGDTEFRYTVTTEGDYRFGPYTLHIKAESTSGEVVYEGPLEGFVEQQMESA